MKSYDLVYLTNTPSFYKLNLCEAIAKTGVKILLVFYGYGEEAVNTELDGTRTWTFDFEFINEGDSNKRNKIITFFKLLRLMKGIKCKKILFAGWLAPEYNLYSYFSSTKKNVVVCESSIFDVSFSGIKGIIKRSIIERMSEALPSGEPHKALFDSIGFKGISHITGSVGIFNKDGNRKSNVNAPLRYIFVGRLIDVKGIELLIDVFNNNGLHLTIVGDGVLKEKLKKKSKANITFLGFVPNEKTGDIYCSHDVFILPSKYEPWGLVVEEALYRGLPVIVSDAVGSSIDMVKNLNTGEIFKSGDELSLQSAIDKVSLNYKEYQKFVDMINWEDREKRQVEAYTQLLK